MKQKFEKPQDGNPHELPIRQHVFPKASIERFYALDDRVEVRHLSLKKDRRAKSTDQTFCVMRAWGAKAEFGYMKNIEDEFQLVASRIAAEATYGVNLSETEAVTRFFALWKIRAFVAVESRLDMQLNAVTGHVYTKDEEEKFEKSGVVAIRGDGSIPYHRANETHILMKLDRAVGQLAISKWGVVRSQSGEFAVPDFPAYGIIPITPKLSLISDFHDTVATEEMITQINGQVASECREYLFAHSIGKCPGLLS